MPVLIVLYLFLIGILALFAQMILPVILAVTFPALNVFGLSSGLIPLVVIYASLELGDIRAPILAAILGLLLDLTSSYHLGTSMLVLTSLSALIATQAQKPEAHHWTFQLIFVLVGTFAYLLLDYIFILVENGALGLAAGCVEQDHLRLADEPDAEPDLFLPGRTCRRGCAAGDRPTKYRSAAMLDDDVRVQGWRLGVLAIVILRRGESAPEPALECADREFGLGAAALGGDSRR